MDCPRTISPPALILLLAAAPICLGQDQSIERLNQASRLVAKKQWAAAAAEYQKVLQTDPKHAHAMAGLARVHVGQQRFTKAIELLKKLKQQNPAPASTTWVEQWHVIGPFPNPYDGKGLNVAYPPEREIKLDASYAGRNGDLPAMRQVMAKVNDACAACHKACRTKMPAMPAKAALKLPRLHTEIGAFAAGLKDKMQLKAALKMACGAANKGAGSGNTYEVLLGAATMEAVQSRLDGKRAGQAKYVAAGKEFCKAAAALEAATRAPQTIKWRKMTRAQAQAMDKSWTKTDHAVIYGYATLNWQREDTVELRVGSDDGCKVWLNGQHVWTNPARRGVNPDSDRIIVRLEKGENRLLMKVEQGLMNYGMTAKIVRGMNVDGAINGAQQAFNKLRNKGLVRLSATGLKPESQTQYWVYKGARCVKKARAGRLEQVPPGKYTIRVGFPSGYIQRDFQLEPGKPLELPTGLFEFKQVTPPGIASTVPQKLYDAATGKYLGTGYQGQTARLYPGKYRVCYQGVNQEKPSLLFSRWHAIGVWPNDIKKHNGFRTVYPPEKEPMPNLKTSYPMGNAQLKWTKLLGEGPELNIAATIPRWGVAYATASIESPDDGLAEIIFTHRGGYKAWLNGQPIKTVQPIRRAYYTQCTTAFAQFNRGLNVLFVKSPRANYLWPISAVAVRWQTYDVEVVADDDQ